MPMPDWHLDNPPHPGPALGCHSMPTPERCHRSDPKRRPATDVAILANRVAEPQVDPGVQEFLPEKADTGPFPAGPVTGGRCARAKEICSLYIDLVTREGREV